MQRLTGYNEFYISINVLIANANCETKETGRKTEDGETILHFNVTHTKRTTAILQVAIIRLIKLFY